MYVIYFSTLLLEKELNNIWLKLNLSPEIRWATFDAISSSAPELITSIIWLLILSNAQEWFNITIWTIWWSAVFNILIIPAFVILYYKYKTVHTWKSKCIKHIKKSVSVFKNSLNNEKIENKYEWNKRDMLIYMISINILIFWLIFNQLLLMSIWLISLYIYYIYLLKKDNKWNKEKIDDNKRQNIKIKYSKLFISIFFIYISIKILIDIINVTWNIHWISSFILSMIIIATITSIPDTILSVKSSIKWDMEAWLTNAVWSNIFDICIWIWLPTMIFILFYNKHIEFNGNLQLSLFIFLIFSIFLHYFIFKNKNIKKSYAYIFLFSYLIYLLFILYM